MALTAASVQRESVGSLTLHIANFATVTSGASGDTWSSGLPNIISAWAQTTTACTSPITCSFVSSTGVITINSEDSASEVNLFVLSKT